jgi:hypothetical protein
VTADAADFVTEARERRVARRNVERVEKRAERRERVGVELQGGGGLRVQGLERSLFSDPASELQGSEVALFREEVSEVFGLIRREAGTGADRESDGGHGSEPTAQGGSACPAQ